MFGIFRLGSLIVVAVMAVIILGVGGNLDAGLPIATGVLTIISVIPVIVIDFLRRGVFTSWVAVELAWMGVLWVLWLATGAQAANSTCEHICHEFGLPGNCETGSLCSQIDLLAAFGFIGWILLLAIWIWTLYIAISAHNRGDTYVWQQSAAEYAPGGRVGATATPMTARGPMVGAPAV